MHQIAIIPKCNEWYSLLHNSAHATASNQAALALNESRFTVETRSLELSKWYIYSTLDINIAKY